MATSLNKTKQVIKTNKLFSKKQALLVSFSGGADSVFLVETLINLDYKNLTLIYFNHHLREKSELDNEVLFCKNYAEKRHLKLKIKSLPVNYAKKKYKNSIEETARILRRGYLAHYAKLKKHKIILMAHHYNDQIESILLRYQQGTQQISLPIQTISQLTATITIYRPLLNINKKDILKYLKSNNLTYCEDSTNINKQFRRNQIRHQWLPLLASIHPSFDTLLYKSNSVLEKLILTN